MLKYMEVVIFMKGSNLNLSFGLEQIYVNANFQLNDFDKVGVVGVNGAGKTTLFKIILKEQELDSGKIKIVNKNIGYLPQEIILENKDITVFEYIMSARPIDKLNKKLIELYNEVAITSGKEQEIIMKKISKVQAELEYYDCYNAENILLELISDMQIDFELLDMRLSDLSGGQKSKVAFAHLLYSKPEILLLDEPTNHLDVTTREFITNYLKKYKGMVLIISHDVDFLNKIVNKILYVNKVNKSLTVYDGNYDIYKKKLEDEKEFQNRLIDKQEKEIKELQEFVEKAKKASRTNHNLKKMGKDREIKLARKLEELGTRERVYRKIRLNIKPNKSIVANIAYEIDDINNINEYIVDFNGNKMQLTFE